MPNIHRLLRRGQWRGPGDDAIAELSVQISWADPEQSGWCRCAGIRVGPGDTDREYFDDIYVLADVLKPAPEPAPYGDSLAQTRRQRTVPPLPRRKDELAHPDWGM